MKINFLYQTPASLSLHMICLIVSFLGLYNAPIYASFLAQSTDSTFVQENLEDLDSLTRLALQSGYENVVINSIDIIGNKRTKAFIILREMDIVEGDTLALKSIPEVFERNENQIYNTSLFNDVQVNVSAQNDNSIQITVRVEERWYIIPAPIFELTDDFNVWWQTFDCDFRRTEYGLLFTDVNFRGRKEQLRFHIRFGYTQKFELAYRIPFVDKAQKLGLTPFVSYTRNSRIAYHTNQHIRIDLSPDSIPDVRYLRQRFRAGLVAKYRPQIKSTHEFNLSYYNNSIADTLASAAKSKGYMYFNDHATKQQYFYVSYRYMFDNRDIRAYPLNGSYLGIQVTKAGLGIFKDLNMFWAILSYTQYFPIAPKLYGVSNFRGQISLPSEQPYFNIMGMRGGNNYVRGYELYNIEGQYFALWRNSIKYELINTKFVNPFFKARQFNTIPFAAYIKTNIEMGYVHDVYHFEENPLTNTFLYGTGAALDLILAYDAVFSLEYTRNHLNNWGFYVTFGVNYDF